jgi:hypothetical protein
MGSITVLQTDRQHCLDDAKDTLTLALDKGFECVLVIGIRKDGRIWAQKSDAMNRLQFLGAVELAKTLIIDGWD